MLVEAAEYPTRIALEDLLALRLAEGLGALDIALGVVEIIAGLGIDAAHGADHLGGEQNILDRHDLGEEIDARLVVDAGVEEDVLQQQLREGRTLHVLRQPAIAAPMIGHGAAAMRDD